MMKIDPTNMEKSNLNNTDELNMSNETIIHKTIWNIFDWNLNTRMYVLNVVLRIVCT